MCCRYITFGYKQIDVAYSHVTQKMPQGCCIYIADVTGVYHYLNPKLGRQDVSLVTGCSAGAGSGL
jgi:hypothetical protein